MTGSNDLDRMLASYLEEGPRRAPDRAMDAALTFAAAHPRRRDPLLFLKPDVMARRSSMFSPQLVWVAAVIALTLGAVAAIAVGTRPSPGAGCPAVGGRVAVALAVRGAITGRHDDRAVRPQQRDHMACHGHRRVGQARRRRARSQQADCRRSTGSKRPVTPQIRRGSSSCGRSRVRVPAIAHDRRERPGLATRAPAMPRHARRRRPPDDARVRRAGRRVRARRPAGRNARVGPLALALWNVQ